MTVGLAAWLNHPVTLALVVIVVAVLFAVLGDKLRMFQLIVRVLTVSSG